MALASKKIQQPSPLNPISGQSGKVAQDWAAFFHVLQQTAFAITLSGPTASRPTSSLDGRWIGMPYLDTTLGKPIWLQSVSPDVWIDATGAAV